MKSKHRRWLAFAVAAATTATLWTAFGSGRRPAQIDARDAGRFAMRKLAAGEESDAWRFAELALASDSGQSDARFVRAILRSIHGDRAGALADVEACATSDPGDFSACLEAGVLARSLADGGSSATARRARRWFEEASDRARAAIERDPSDSRAFVVDAAACVALGRIDDAERRLDALPAVVGALADDVVALRAAILVARGAADDARALLRRAVDERGSASLAAMLAELDATPSALVRAGVDAARRGDVSVARVLLRDATRLAPDDLTPATFLAATLAGPDAASAVEEESRRLVDYDRHGALRPFLAGNVLLLGGDPEGAAASFRQALDRSPDDPAALRGAVLAELCCGRAAEAEKLCRARLDRGDPTGATDFLLGASLDQAGARNGAEAAYRAALRKDAANWPASDRLAELLLSRGDVAEAARVCGSGLEIDSSCLPLVLRRADVWVASGDPARAVEALAAEAQARPTCGVVHLHLAGALLAAGDASGAAEQFDLCLGIDSDCVEARIGAIMLATAAGRLDLLVAELSSQATARPRDPAPRFALGAAAEASGEVEIAEREYRAALALAPRFAVAANNLAWLLATRLSRPREARLFAETAGKLLPRNPHVLDTRGWVRFLDGDPVLAEADLARAVAMLPDRPEVARRHELVLAALKSADEQPSVPEPRKESPR